MKGFFPRMKAKYLGRPVICYFDVDLAGLIKNKTSARALLRKTLKEILPAPMGKEYTVAVLWSPADTITLDLFVAMWTGDMPPGAQHQVPTPEDLHIFCNGKKVELLPEMDVVPSNAMVAFGYEAMHYQLVMERGGNLTRFLNGSGPTYPPPLSSYPWPAAS